MRSILKLGALAGVLMACAPAADNAAERTWTMDDGVIFPAARGLARAEDGLALADGRLIVIDQRHGLSLINADETTRPFGRFAEVGYLHAPPAQIAGPNGVSLEPDGVHALVADVYTGAIYRVNLETEAVELVYTHPFGVNTAVADSSGAIWFTQSAANTAGPQSEARLFEPLNNYAAEGALFRLAPPAADGARAPAQKLVEGLQFANGVVIDEARGQLYFAETMGDRINAYSVAVDTGELGDHRVLASVVGPDNVEIDEHGSLWVASPIQSALIVIDPETGAMRTAFRESTPESDAIVAEWSRRAALREGAMELFTPDLWGRLPGAATGMILTAGDGPIYVTGLADALVKVER
jgi:sugar lactone lactonase YvrE